MSTKKIFEESLIKYPSLWDPNHRHYRSSYYKSIDRETLTQEINNKTHCNYTIADIRIQVNNYQRRCVRIEKRKLQLEKDTNRKTKKVVNENMTPTENREMNATLNTTTILTTDYKPSNSEEHRKVPTDKANERCDVKEVKEEVEEVKVVKEEVQEVKEEVQEVKEMNLETQSICNESDDETTLPHGDDDVDAEIDIKLDFDENNEDCLTDENNSQFLPSKCKKGSSIILKESDETPKTVINNEDCLSDENYSPYLSSKSKIGGSIILKKSIKIPKTRINNKVSLTDEINYPSLTSKSKIDSSIIINEINDIAKATIINEDSLTDENKCLSVPSKCKIDSVIILKELDEIAKAKISPADKILITELKNMWGRNYFEKHLSTKQDDLIQRGLKEWNVWSMSSKSRGPPAMYKCYICVQAWWHLGPFRDHLRQHNESNLAIYLETNFHECNMAACLGEKPIFKSDFKIDSDCWKCGNDLDFHRRTEGYKCETCSTRFFTCTEMSKHFCKSKKRKAAPPVMYQCHLCDLIMYSSIKFDDHCIRYHSVRSDLPIFSSGRICTLCDQYFPHASSHHCPRTCCDKKLSKCKFCDRKFPSRLMSKVHETNSIKKIRCRICEDILPAQCMEMMHIAKVHSDNFLILHKCILCEDNVMFFNDSIDKHIDVWHTKVNDTDFIEEVVVPKSCIRPEMIENVYITCVNGKYLTVAMSNEEIRPRQEDKKNKERQNSGIIEKVVTDNIVTNEENDVDKEVVNKKPRLLHNERLGEELIADDEHIVIKEEINPKEYTDAAENSGTYAYEDILCTVFGTKPFGKDIAKLKPQEPTQKSKVVEVPKPIIEPFLLSTSKSLQFCEKCGFKGTPNDHRKHKWYCLSNYHCTKCNDIFKILDHYVLHYTQHGYLENTCPDCNLHMGSNAGLVFHMQDHMRRCFSKTIDGSNVKEDAYVCRECKETVDVALLFAHWESHLKLEPKNSASTKPWTEKN